MAAVVSDLSIVLDRSSQHHSAHLASAAGTRTCLRAGCAFQWPLGGTVSGEPASTTALH